MQVGISQCRWSEYRLGKESEEPSMAHEAKDAYLVVSFSRSCKKLVIEGGPAM